VKNNRLLSFIFFLLGLIDSNAFSWIEGHFMGIEGTLLVNGLGFIPICIIIIIRYMGYVGWGFRRASWWVS
jgi:hypothetical protein